MALQPYNRRVAIGDSAGPVGIADTNIIDISQSIRGIGQAVMKAYEPVLQEKAQKEAIRSAGMEPIKDADGNFILPKNDEGGIIYRQAFDKVAQARYLTAVGTEFQSYLDNDMALRREGKLPYDRESFKASTAGHLEGVLEGVDPMVRPQLEELLAREAGERIRAFENETSRVTRQQTLQGMKDQFALLDDQMMNPTKHGRRPGDGSFMRLYAQKLELLDASRDAYLLGGPEYEAELMRLNVIEDNYERWDKSHRIAPILYQTMQTMSEDQHRALDPILRGLEIGDFDVSDLTVQTESVDQLVSPEGFVTDIETMFGIKVTSGQRDAQHPLSIANPTSYHSSANGGRAIDIPAIKGMKFEEFVLRVEEAGYEVVEALDEYKNPSAHATGGHWHIAVAATRTTTENMPLDLDSLELPEGITMEDLLTLDGSVAADLIVVNNSMRAEKESDRRERLAQIRHEQTIAAKERETQTIVDALNEANRNNARGDLSAKEEKALTAAFDQQVDFGLLSRGTPEEKAEQRAKVMAFTSEQRFIPDSLIAYMDNEIRSDTGWQGAYDLYENLMQVTLANDSGTRPGDMLLDALDSRSQAMLEEVGRLKRIGQNPEQIGARVEGLRAGTVYTTKEAIDIWSSSVGDDDVESYKVTRDAALRKHFMLGPNAKIPAQLSRDIDAAYAANLDIVSRNPQSALRLAVDQASRGYEGSRVFTEGYGPRSLLATFEPQEIQDFLEREVDQDGRRLLHSYGGVTPVVGKHITLRPADSDTRRVGRYVVFVKDPNNPAVLRDQFEIDLGKEMTDSLRGTNIIRNEFDPEEADEKARADAKAKRERSNKRMRSFGDFERNRTGGKL